MYLYNLRQYLLYTWLYILCKVVLYISCSQWWYVSLLCHNSSVRYKYIQMQQSCITKLDMILTLLIIYSHILQSVWIVTEIIWIILKFHLYMLIMCFVLRVIYICYSVENINVVEGYLFVSCKSFDYNAYK